MGRPPRSLLNSLRTADKYICFFIIEFHKCSGRGRGLYRNRGRGNFYRHPAPHQQLPMAQHSHSTMPYYDPSVNLLNNRGGPYRDSSYQDIHHNRYETVTPFDKNRDRIINLICILSILHTEISI